MNIWSKLKKEKIEKALIGDKFVEPILVLAPMADVTDVAFRRVIAENGKPDAMWTEFVSADGLILAPNDNPDENGFTSQDKLRADLKYSEVERPIIAQIFGSRPENIKKTAKLIYDLGFDGIDINMGCPDRSIEKQGCGSAMIKNPKLAKAIIRATKEGVGYDLSFWLILFSSFKAFGLKNFAYHLFEFKLKSRIPISVKTRLGYNRDQLEEWLPELLSAWPSLVTVHARTRKQMSKTQADWSRVKRAVEIRDEFYNKKRMWRMISPVSRTLIFGNGDVMNRKEAVQKTKETSCDGVMIGRGIFGNPWLFGDRKREDISLEERLKVMIQHTKLFKQELPFKNFAIMKKHYKAYVDGFDGAKELRVKLMEKENAKEVEREVENFL